MFFTKTRLFHVILIVFFGLKYYEGSITYFTDFITICLASFYVLEKAIYYCSVTNQYEH